MPQRIQATETAGGHGADVVGIQTPGEESKARGEEESEAQAQDAPLQENLNLLINRRETGLGVLRTP